MAKTEQENFWAGEFGDKYLARNAGAKIIAGNISIFSNVLKSTRHVRSLIEFGSNIGLNLSAIKQLLPDIELSAIEINKKAANKLKKDGVNVYHKSIIDFQPDYQRDFVLIKGVLIHMNPQLLPEVYDLLYKTSSNYICIAEYYNPTPVSVIYRGHTEKLYKRDFAGEMLDRFKDLELIDYGFTYHRDTSAEHDDITWFLLQKKSA